MQVPRRGSCGASAKTREPARAYVIGEAENVRAVRALSIIVVERTLDIITVVVMLMIKLPFIDAPGWARGQEPEARGPALFLGLGSLGLAVLLATLSAARERAIGLVGWGVCSLL